MLVVLGCGDRELPPAPQIVLYVDTDAIVARREGDPRALSPQVDRVRFDLSRADQPVPGGARVFPVDDAAFQAGRVSIGILPEGGARPTVRVRLYRADRALSEDVPAGVAIDAVVDLPEARGVTEAFVFLAADDFGRSVPRVTASLGRPPASRASTWRGGRRVGCAAPARAGEACVPGGAFFFGDPAFRGRTFANDIYDERVVWVSPFYLDVHEVTVAELRASNPRSEDRPALRGPRRTETDLAEEAAFCTYTETPDAFEALPVNCLTWNAARAYCQAQGKDLPSEVQFEFAASGLGDERAYPWGDDESDCAGAIWGRGGDGLYRTSGSAACRTGVTEGPAVPGGGGRDTVDTTGRGGSGAPILDLGGNLSEWMVDAWNEPAGFWKSLEATADPVVLGAFPAGPDDLRVARGGAFPYTILTARAAYRLRREAGLLQSNVGFRCARRADPAAVP